MGNVNTPYDDSFRTLLTDCRRLVVPLVNEIFGENWSDDEQVELYQNELFITAGADKKRITDSHVVIGGYSRRYHLECQSSTDGTIVVLIFEYASQVAVTTAQSEKAQTVFTLPASGIIYLRCGEDVAQGHVVVIDTPRWQSVVYNSSLEGAGLRIRRYPKEEIILSDSVLLFQI